jgi:hypothetical protein
MSMSFDVIAIANLAARAELGWRGADGGLDAAAFVPLVIDGHVIAALPFAHAGVARRLAGATAATLVFSDSRMAHKGWSSCAVPVSVDVTADRTGEWTWTGALDQEVRKHPPARLLIDTAIQRREHWWYVPRWIVRLRVGGNVQPVARRQGACDGVLFVDGAHGPSARTVAVEEWDADVVRVTPLDAPAADAAGPALLFGHDFSIPDQERSSRLVLHGDLDGRLLRVRRREGALALPAARLLHRLRAHYRLERACRRALAIYDASPSAAAT